MRNAGMPGAGEAGAYRGPVTRRSDVDQPPAAYLVSGEWPEGTVEGPAAAAYARQLALNLHEAMGERSLRELGREAGVHHTTIRAILMGERWADLVTIAKLEQALEVRLWPDLV